MFSKNAEAEPLLEDGRGAKDVAPQGTKRSTRAFKIIGLVGLCVAALGATAVVASRTSHVETKTDEMVVAVESVCAGLAVSVVGLAAEPECEACALIAAAGDLFADLWALVGTGTAVAAKVISDGEGTIIDDTPGNDFCPSDGLRYNCQDTTCKYERPCSSNVVGQDESGKHCCACPYTKTLGQGEQMCDADGLFYNLADPTCNLERPCASNSGLMAGACPSFPPFIRSQHPDLDLQFCDSDGLWYSLDVDFCKYSRKCASNNGLYASACPAPKPGYPDEQFCDIDGLWYVPDHRRKLPHENLPLGVNPREYPEDEDPENICESIVYGQEDGNGIEPSEIPSPPTISQSVCFANSDGNSNTNHPLARGNTVIQGT